MRITFQFYFKKYQSHGYDKIPRDVPVIYAANHQNAFLDALCIIMLQAKHPMFLVRANVFKNSIARFWLTMLNMMPIYRAADGIRNVAKNEEILANCIRLLAEKQQPIGIFAEGNHNMNRSLRPLQKGIARIAFDSENQYDRKLGLVIVPIGLNYSSHTKFRSDMLVNYGEPIKVIDYFREYDENPAKALNNLKEEISNRIKGLMVDIKPKEHYDVISTEWQNRKTTSSRLIDELTNDQKIVKEIAEEIESGKIPSGVRNSSWKPGNWIKKIFGFPIFVYGYLNHIIVHTFLKYILTEMVKDNHFYGSIKYAVGLFFVPGLYIIQSSTFFIITGDWILACAYLFTLPVFGIFAFEYGKLWKKPNPVVVKDTKYKG